MHDGLEDETVFVDVEIVEMGGQNLDGTVLAHIKEAEIVDPFALEGHHHLNGNGATDTIAVVLGVGLNAANLVCNGTEFSRGAEDEPIDIVACEVVEGDSRGGVEGEEGAGQRLVGGDAESVGDLVFEGQAGEE